MRSRALVAAIAIAMAAVATMAVFLYVQGIEDQVKTGGKATTVIIAQQDIPAGTDLDDVITDGAFTNTTVPEEDVVVGAVDSLSDLQNQKTRSPILEGEQVSTARLQGSTDLPGGVLGIPDGHEAVTLALDVPRVLATSVESGDHVKIFGTFSLRTSTGTKDVTINLVPDVQVLEFSGAGASAESQGSSQPLITMALKAQDSHDVIFAIEKGTVWLSLLPPDEAGKQTKPVTIGKLLKRSP